MSRRALGWVLGSVLLAVPCFHAGFVQSRTVEDTAGDVTGAALAPLIFGGLIALLVRWLYVRQGVGHGRVWSPWLTVIAFVPAVFTAVQDPGAERKAVSRGPDVACSQPAPRAKKLTGALPPGVHSVALLRCTPPV